MARAGDLVGCRGHGAENRPCNGRSMDMKGNDFLIFGSQCFLYSVGAAIKDVLPPTGQLALAFSFRLLVQQCID